MALGWTRNLVVRKAVRLQVIISAIFAMLILPALGVVIAFSYYENAHTLANLLERSVDGARDDAMEMSEKLIEPVASVLRIIAAAEEAIPGFFRSDNSANLLYQAMVSNPQVDAAYVSFENGFHRVVTRIDDDRRRSDPKIPANAKWHMSFIDDFSAGADRQRHRTFYDAWPTPVARYSVATTLDVRTAVPQYQLARRTLALAVSDPFINPDTGYPVIGLGYPILVESNFVGVASAQITLGALSQLVAHHEASPNSVTVIADEHGQLLAHPVAGKAARLLDGQLQLTDWGSVGDAQVAEAIRLHASRHADRFTFQLEPESKEYVALFSHFPVGAARNWQVLVVTPTDDFVGELKRTNAKLIWLMLTLVLLESVLIYFMARRISRPIEIVSDAIQRIRSLSFGGRIEATSSIYEIAQLQRTTTLLDNALRSFSLFAPVGIVRDLIESGQPITPGMEQRFITIFFCDIEGFATIAEQLQPVELSEQVSYYFDTITAAVAEEGGTIDKFIGDSVMAFWGAPAQMDDHVFHACIAALKANDRMVRLNGQWAREGRKQMIVRFGLHCDTVVVGNVGSRERLSYTVMGDGVNVASRIEGLNKKFSTSICISDSVYKHVAGRVIVRALGRAPVKGRATEIMIYELLGIVGINDPELHAGRADIEGPAG